jgi:hypothetical protein
MLTWAHRALPQSCPDRKIGPTFLGVGLHVPLPHGGHSKSVTLPQNRVPYIAAARNVSRVGEDWFIAYIRGRLPRYRLPGTRYRWPRYRADIADRLRIGLGMTTCQRFLCAARPQATPRLPNSVATWWRHDAQARQNACAKCA